MCRVEISDKELREKFNLFFRVKTRRQKRKQWGKIVDSVGYDSFGFTNYARIANFMADNLSTQEEHIVKYRKV